MYHKCGPNFEYKDTNLWEWTQAESHDCKCNNNEELYEVKNDIVFNDNSTQKGDNIKKLRLFKFKNEINRRIENCINDCGGNDSGNDCDLVIFDVLNQYNNNGFDTKQNGLLRILVICTENRNGECILGKISTECISDS